MTVVAPARAAPSATLIASRRDLPQRKILYASGLLDRHRGTPVLQKAVAKENELLARAAGVPAMSPSLVDRGREIADSARDLAVLPEIAPAAEPQPSLLTRLRNALAA